MAALELKGLHPLCYMYGENCRHKSGFYNLKDSEGLRRHLRIPSSVKLIFMDDNPQRIIPDRNSQVVALPTYSHSHAGTERDDLVDAIVAVKQKSRR